MTSKTKCHSRTTVNSGEVSEGNQGQFTHKETNTAISSSLPSPSKNAMQ